MESKPVFLINEIAEHKLSYIHESIYTFLSITHPQEVLIHYFDRQNQFQMFTSRFVYL